MLSILVRSSKELMKKTVKIMKKKSAVKSAFDRSIRISLSLSAKAKRTLSSLARDFHSLASALKRSISLRFSRRLVYRRRLRRTLPLVNLLCGRIRFPTPKERRRRRILRRCGWRNRRFARLFFSVRGGRRRRRVF